MDRMLEHDHVGAAAWRAAVQRSESTPALEREAQLLALRERARMQRRAEQRLERESVAVDDRQLVALRRGDRARLQAAVLDRDAVLARRPRRCARKVAGRDDHAGKQPLRIGHDRRSRARERGFTVGRRLRAGIRQQRTAREVERRVRRQLRAGHEPHPPLERPGCGRAADRLARAAAAGTEHERQQRDPDAARPRAGRSCRHSTSDQGRPGTIACQPATPRRRAEARTPRSPRVGRPGIVPGHGGPGVRRIAQHARHADRVRRPPRRSWSSGR